jgi:hypothetical protein
MHLRISLDNYSTQRSQLTYLPSLKTHLTTLYAIATAARCAVVARLLVSAAPSLKYVKTYTVNLPP